MRSGIKSSWMVGLIALGIFALCGSSAFAGGERIVVRVGESFEVDGTLYSPGKLSVRVLREYTPTSTLNEVWVGNQRVGMMLARLVASGTESATDTALFRRNDEGNLVLTGFALRGDSGARLYLYGSQDDAVAQAAKLEPEKTGLRASR